MNQRRLGAAFVTACVAVAGTLAAAAGPSAATAKTVSILVPSSTLSCQYDPCYSPQQFRVAYGIPSLLDRGIDGRGETVSVVVPAASPKQPAEDIRQDLVAFDRMFQLPAARIEVVSSLAGAASPWQATEEEVNDTEIVPRSPPPPRSASFWYPTT